MRVSSLKERIERLESDLLAKPPRISAYQDLPFAILRYDPAEEWDLRRQMGLLINRLGNQGKEIVRISLADLFWEALEASEGVETLARMERERGFERAQQQATVYLTDPDWSPLPDLLERRLAGLDPARHVAFLWRATALAPAIYHMSKLLDEMQGRTAVTTILFYPGSLEGTTGLRFMSLREYEAPGNYRVKIYD
jgi:hypothetical protein